MPKQDIFIILNNRPQNGYTSGSTITGRVIITNDRVQRTTGIKITLLGLAEVALLAPYRGRIADHKWYNHSSSEIIFELKMDLLYLTGRSLKLEPGCHKYPFSFRLPRDIPSSFERIKGKIEYKLTATMKGIFITDRTTTLPLVVVDYLDLNRDPRTRLPIAVQFRKNFSILRCSNPIEIVLRVPKSGFTPEETVTMEIKIANNSRSNIRRAEIFLVQEVSYKAICRTEVEFQKFRLKNSPSVSSGENTALRATLKIPNLPATNLSSVRGRIIRVQYFLELKLTFSCWEKAFVRRIPIIIGTVPIQSHSDQPSRTSQSQNVPLNNSYFYNSNIRTIILPAFRPSVPVIREFQYNPSISGPFDEHDSDDVSNCSGFGLPPPYENFAELPPSYIEAIKLEMAEDDNA